MRSKHKREQILFLKTEDGELIRDPEGILNETHGFYTDLFTQEEEEESIVEESRACLNLLKETIKNEDNAKLVKEPDESEIERIVTLLPSDKAPGLDGIIIEGCPLAPLLFSLSTQPLMALLQAAQIEGRVQGIEAGLTKDGYKELTKICRGFVWGSNREGKEKKALVAWDIFCRRKEEEGVGLTSFELQANALKMRFVGKLLEDADLDWVQVAKAILQWKVADTASRWEELTWAPREVLMLGGKMKLNETPTLWRMLEGWWAAKRWLVFKGSPGSLPRSLQIEQALRIGIQWSGLSRSEANQVKRYLLKNQVLRLQELNQGAMEVLYTHDRSKGTSLDPTQGPPFQGPLRKTNAFLTEQTQGNTLGANELGENRLWQWKKEGRQLEGWNLPTKDWRWLFSTTSQTHHKWNKCWSTN
ncbi:hypothetical protein R1sor_000963 [Riccia sorocarpa]|uniref:Uncharacterized protein n=1 Tax=Riccia sorocarpa TaxID=122646 RepID=A0ABD3GWA5_9MARC